MNFRKFLSLLEKSALFFPRADRLGDPYEGSYSEANVKIRPVTYKDWPKFDLKTWSKFNKMLPVFTAVNCWHLNEHDSAAMWELYLPANEGVAIRSTFARLRDSLYKEKDFNICIGEIEYIDYKNELMSREGFVNAFLYKRKSFEHEHELRAVIQHIPSKKTGKNKGELNFDRPLCKDGINVEVDLNTLIDKIFIPPTSEEWHRELVESIIKKRYGLMKEVYKSEIFNKENVVY